MKFFIVAGRPESGKRDALFALGNKLVAGGKKGAIILTEKEENGFDYKNFSTPDLKVNELFVDCTPCSLRFILEKMLTKMRDSDFVIIELSGSTLLLETKQSLELMKLPNISFAPIVYFANAETFRTDIPAYPEFFLAQIRDSNIICINKGAASEAQIANLHEFLKEHNPDTMILELLSTSDGENYRDLFKLLAVVE